MYPGLLQLEGISTTFSRHEMSMKMRLCPGKKTEDRTPGTLKRKESGTRDEKAPNNSNTSCVFLKPSWQFRASSKSSKGMQRVLWEAETRC